MTSPTAPIDGDLSPQSNDVYYVIETGAIWKTANLTDVGAATWVKVWDSATDFETEAGETFSELLRIKQAPNTANLVYVIGTGNDGAADKPFILRSANAGTTWVLTWIEEELDFGAGGLTLGTITDGASPPPTFVMSGGGGDIYYACVFSGATQFQGNWYNVQVIFPEALPAASTLTLEYDVIGDSPSEQYDADGDNPADFYYITFLPAITGTFTPTDDGYHFSGNIDTSRLPSLEQIPVGWFQDRQARFDNYTAATRAGVITNITIDGVVYGGASKAFDVAPSNSNWLYLGLVDKILKSEDGGYTWSTLTEDHGAYDICVDPQAAGAIYYWDTDGELRLRVAGIDQGSLLSDLAFNQHGRLARDPSSGRLWAITLTGEIKMRNLGTWSTQNTDMVGAKSIRAYTGGKLIYAENSDIYYSDDYGVTWTAKVGGWAAYDAPQAIHLMKASA